MQLKAVVCLFGAATVARALWFPVLARNDVSYITVTETVHDGVCATSEPGPGGLPITAPSPVLSPAGNSGYPEATTTLTITIGSTQISTITLQVPATTTVSTSNGVPPITTVSTSNGALSSNNGGGEGTSTDTYDVTIVSTVVVVPLSTPPAAQPTTTEGPSASQEATTTVFVTQGSTQQITVPRPPVYPTVWSNATAPYGNSSSLAYTTYVTAGTGLSAAPQTTIASNSSTTCTDELSNTVATTATVTTSASATLSEAASSYPLSVGSNSTSAAPMNISSSSIPTVASIPVGTGSSIVPFTSSLLPAASYLPHGPNDSGYPLATVTPTNSSGIMKRQIGATVTATINGVVVTWINSYSPTTTLVATPTIAITPGVSSGDVPQQSSVLPHSVPRPSDTTVPKSPTPHTTSIATVPISSLSAQSTRTTKTVQRSSSKTSAASCSATNGGRFTIDFDDLPTVSADENTESYAPFESPYHNLFWSDGFSYVPLPKDPYVPTSKDHLGVFIVNGNANIHSDNFTGPVPSGLEVNGMFGAGSNYKSPSFWFDAFTVSIGCNNTGPEPCDIRVSGFKFDEYNSESMVQVRENYTHQACTKPAGCQLEEIGFGIHFKNLTGMQINAYKTGTQVPISWFMDDLNLKWSNISCAAIAERESMTQGPHA